jgi:hypothetical protein
MNLEAWGMFSFFSNTSEMGTDSLTFSQRLSSSRTHTPEVDADPQASPTSTPPEKYVINDSPPSDTERRGREADERDRSPLKKVSSRKSGKGDGDPMLDYVLQRMK